MQKHHPILNSSVFLFSVSTLFFIHNSTALDTRHGTKKFEACKQRLKCGRSLELTYPFWGGNRSRDCGHPYFQIYCIENKPTMKIKSKEYRVLYVSEERHALTVVRMDMKDDGCPEDLVNITLDTHFLNISPGYTILNFVYNCSRSSEIPYNSTCPKGFYVNEFARPGNGQACSNLLWFPVPTSLPHQDPRDVETSPKEVLKRGFNLEYNADWQSCLSCVTGRGQCGHDWSRKKFICYLPEQGAQSLLPYLI